MVDLDLQSLACTCTLGRTSPMQAGWPATSNCMSNENSAWLLGVLLRAACWLVNPISSMPGLGSLPLGRLPLGAAASSSMGGGRDSLQKSIMTEGICTHVNT